VRACLLALCLLAACTRSTDPRLYTLVAEASRASYPIAATIEVRRPSIAGYLDRREIVLGVRDEQLELARDSHWAEPLDAMIGRVLAADLALRLPKSQVLTDLSSLGVVPGVRIDTEVQRFELGADGLVLRAMVVIRRGAESSPAHLETVELVDRAAGHDSPAVVAALNGLLGKLADRVASSLASALALPPGAPP
jgi:uncharacterized protein